MDGGRRGQVPDSQVWMVGGTWGTPLARSGWWRVPEVPPWPGLDGWKGWWGDTWGTPQPGLDGGWYSPGQVWMVGVPRVHTQPGLDGGGVHQVLPCQDWMGTSPPTPIRQSSIASTCYSANGMPLAFTQEDFLVWTLIFIEQNTSRPYSLKR